MATSLPRPVKAQIQMVCPIREVLVQEIPISNTSERDYVIKATIVSEPDKNGHYFYINSQGSQ